MKKVGFITSALNSGHAGRGIGVYTGSLFQYLIKNAPACDIEVTGITESESASGNFDLIHYPYFDLFFHTLPLFPQTKFVVTCHDVIPLEYPGHYPPGVKGLVNLVLQKYALARAGAVITDSYASVKAIRKYLSVDHSRLKMIYLGPIDAIHPISDKKKLQAVAKKYSLPAEFVLNVGDINWNKNIPGLVKACVSLKVPLVLIGRQAVRIDELDDSHPELRHLQELKPYFTDPKSGIIRLGFLPDADFAAVCNLATVYCQSSFAEGFGLSVLHAMACGTPVACSSTHSLPEIAGDAAVYFDPHNQADLTDALSRLLHDPRLRSSMSAMGIKQAKKFTWDKAARETLTVYRQVLEEK